MMSAYENNVVIITGGSSGIGRAAALDFAGKGAYVLITGRRSGPLEAIARAHAKIESLVADTAKPEDAARTVGHALALWGRLDVLVNNAGAGSPMPLASATAERVSDIFAVNVLGPTLLAAQAIPHLEAAKGTIINVSSTFGHKAIAGFSHYAASKAALEHLTRCWALELAPQRVRVNAVAAGPAETAALQEMMGFSPEQAEAVREHERKLIPLGRRGTAEEVARWIVALADPAADWITGEVISVDGGLGIT
jgi:NAD(P)-dependent dehydrogenase (short-subunit alcohol dehydrogenase family)